VCTVSIVPVVDGCRVMCNRDERRTRAVAQPPRTWPTEVSWATYPQDPVSGGTWIGVNDDGLVVALLNRMVGSAKLRTAPHSFERLVLAGDDWLRGQFWFHRHRWAGRLELSVQMSRPDACTVSRTTIDVTSRRIDLQYESLANPVSTQRPAA